MNKHLLVAGLSAVCLLSVACKKVTYTPSGNGEMAVSNKVASGSSALEKRYSSDRTFSDPRYLFREAEMSSTLIYKDQTENINIDYELNKEYNGLAALIKRRSFDVLNTRDQAEKIIDRWESSHAPFPIKSPRPLTEWE